MRRTGPFGVLHGISELAGAGHGGDGGPDPAGRRAAQPGLLQMLPAVAAGRLWLESQTHLSGVLSHETQLASCRSAAAAEAGTGPAVCAASAGLRVVGRLHGRCADLWPTVPSVQYRG